MVSKVICPKCKSEDVGADWSIQAHTRRYSPPTYKCNKCGFVGIFPEID